MKSKADTIIIFTGLPFRKQGNQSLIRFVNMFLSRDFEVIMYSAGHDTKGENVIDSPLFSLYKISSIGISFTILLNKVASKLKRRRSLVRNYFDQIKSEDIVPPYGNYNFTNLINKWMKYIFSLVDNMILFIYIILFHSAKIKKATVIVGYETAFTICSRWLSRVYKKKYINKYQGTILKATNRDKALALKYFPNNYFSVNKSDLCLMVQDGTDGKYYAELKGCKNIFLEPHGVFSYPHHRQYDSIINELKDRKKFILFNNASGSTWKRIDRIVRGLLKLDKDVLENTVLITTYHASNKIDLVNFVKSKGLETNVIFLEKIDSYESNYILQNAHVVIMTNDFSNLGNPLLEAIYYKIPIISIDDGSLDGFLSNNYDSLLIKLNDEFDTNMAKAIEKLYNDKELYNKLKSNMNRENQVKELSVQQDREFMVIKKLLEEC